MCGSNHGTRAGYLLRLVAVFSNANAETRNLIAEYLRAFYRHSTAPQQYPAALAIIDPVRETLLSVPTAQSAADLVCLGDTLRFLRELVPDLPETAPLVATTPQTVLTEWAKSKSEKFGLPAVRLIARTTYLARLAAFYCEAQPDCATIPDDSRESEVTGAMLLDAIIGRCDAAAALSAALAALNRDMLDRTQRFLTSPLAPLLLDGSPDVAGFKLSSLSKRDAFEYAESYCSPAISRATVILVSPGTSPLQSTVVFFVEATSREVLCVFETRGLITTVVPMPTVRAMMAHSAAETFRGALNAQLSLARRTLRERLSGAAASGATLNDSEDDDENAADGSFVDVPPAPEDPGVTSGVASDALSAETRYQCRYAATRLSPPASPSKLASLAHLLHVLPSYRDYTQCRHVASDFKHCGPALVSRSSGSASAAPASHTSSVRLRSPARRRGPSRSSVGKPTERRRRRVSLRSSLRSELLLAPLPLLRRRLGQPLGLRRMPVAKCHWQCLCQWRRTRSLKPKAPVMREILTQRRSLRAETAAERGKASATSSAFAAWLRRRCRQWPRPPGPPWRASWSRSRTGVVY